MSISENLQTQLEHLKSILSQIEKALPSEPAGRITVKKNTKGLHDYYISTPLGEKMKYISKSDDKLIRSLLQKKYDHEVLVVVQSQIKVLENCLSQLDDYAVRNVLGKYDRESQAFLNVCEYPDDMYSESWLKKPYNPNPFPLPSVMYCTLNNEQVRSKSEVIIANTLKEANVPYKYECPLRLSNAHVIYPDFTILDVKDRRIWYWEHFGKMDSDDYRKKACIKLEQYASLGLVPGNGLIVTFEDYRNPLSTFVVSQCVSTFEN